MRTLSGPVGIAVGAWAMLAASFHIYTAGFGFFPPLEQRALFLTLFLPLAFLLFPASSRSPKDRPSYPDLVLAALSLAPNLYAYFEANRISLRIEYVDALRVEEIILGSLVVLLVLEAVRRAVTPILAAIGAIMVGYLFVTEYMPGMLHFRDISYERIVETFYLAGGQGVFGFVTGICATMVAVFIVFGAFIEGSGTGRLFSNLGMRLAGTYAGGPAKVAVFSSALMGTMSGSSSANVFTTGTFTIPMMKRLGYKSTFAGGVEAGASVGGQIMPPIMGAAAFIMAETTQTPYSEIILAALLGAVCYFFMVFITVHFEAKRLGLRGMDRREIPSWRSIARDAHLFIPILVLIVLLFLNFSPHFSAFWSIVATLLASWLRRETRITATRLLVILQSAGRNIVPIAMACACANIVIAGLTVTGISVSVGSLILAVSNGQILVAGFLLMFTTLLLGMGVPTSAAYVITAAIGAPVLIQLGVGMLPAHLFVLYFAVLADATPPVSIASYAAASIAQSHPIWTGVQAFRLAFGGFIVAYGYLLTPALTLQGTLSSIIGQFSLTLLALTLISVGLTGYARRALGSMVRAASLLSAFALYFAEAIPLWWRVTIAAAILLGLLVLPGFHAARRGKPGARATR